MQHTLSRTVKYSVSFYNDIVGKEGMTNEITEEKYHTAIFTLLQSAVSDLPAQVSDEAPAITVLRELASGW